MPDIAGLQITIGANVDSAVRAFDDVVKSGNTTANAITASMAKATSSISAIAPASQKAASGVNIIGISFDKAAAKVDEISAAIESIPKPAPIVVDVIANTSEAIQAIKNIPSGAITLETTGIQNLSGAVQQLESTTIQANKLNAALENVSTGAINTGAAISTSASKAAQSVDKIGNATVDATGKITKQGSQFDQVSKKAEGTGAAISGSMNKAASSITNLSKQGGQSIFTLTEKLRVLESAVFTEKDAGKISKFNSQIQNTQKEIGLLSNVGKTGFDNLGNSIEKTHNPLSKAFSGLRSIAYILPGIGIAGIFNLAFVAVEALVEQLLKVGDGANTAKKNLENLNDVIGEANKEAGKQISTLKLLYDAATNVNLTTKERTAAVKELQKEFPDLFGNIKQETILNGGAKDAYDALTLSIRATSRAKAAKGKIDELEAKRLDEEANKLKILNATAQELNAAQATLGKGGQIIGGLGTTTASQGLTKTQAREIIRTRRDLAIAIHEANIKSIDEQEAFITKLAGLPSLAKIIEDKDNPKSIAAIFQALGVTIDDINKKQVVTGVNLNKEKIDADKKAIDELLKTTIDLKDVRLTKLIDEFKALGGTFDETGSKSKTSVHKIQEVLDKLVIAREELNRDPLIKQDDKPLKEINLIQDAIKKLRDLKAKPEIIIGLRTEIGEGAGFTDPATLLEKVIFKDINDFAKNIKTIDIPVPAELILKPHVDIGKTLDEIQKKIDLEQKRLKLAMSKMKVKSAQGIDTTVDLLNDKEVEDNFDNLNKNIKGTAELFDNLLGPAFTSAFDALANGGNVMQAIGNSLKQMITRMIAAAAEAAVLSLILSTIFPGSAPTFGSLFGQLAGIPKFEGGGIATQATFGIFGEKGPEAILPLDRLSDFMKPAIEFPNFLPKHRVSGSELLLWYERSVNQRGKTF